MAEVSNLESYPPLILQHLKSKSDSRSNQTGDKIDPDDDIHKCCYMDDPIPVMDFQCLDWDKLDEACKEWGVFRLVNHGVPVDLLSQIHEHAKMLFSLSFESKEALFNSPLSYFWGTPALTPSGAALFGGRPSISLVEGINFQLSEISIFRAENPMLETFRMLMEEYGRHLARLASRIFEAMVKNLNLDPENSSSNLSESTGAMRVYRYPPCLESDGAIGLHMHTDSSVLSILSQDQVGGLQVIKDDKCFQVKPVPNTLIVNLGDMMQAISTDEYKSVKHRVKSSKEEERFSICYFIFPGEGSLIQNSKYKPFTYTDYQAQVQLDIKTIGSKVGLERFRILADQPR